MGERQFNQYLACSDLPHVGTFHFIIMTKAEAQGQVLLAPGTGLPTFMPTTEFIYLVCLLSICPMQGVHPSHGSGMPEPGPPSSLGRSVARQSEKPVHTHTLPSVHWPVHRAMHL